MSQNEYDMTKAKSELLQQLKKLKRGSSDTLFSKQVLQKQVDQYKNMLEQTKLLMNMVVHDMRNPAEAIQVGLT